MFDHFFTREPKNISSSSVSLQTLLTLARNLMSSPASRLSSYDELRVIFTFVSLTHQLRIIFVTDFLLAISLSYFYDFVFDSWS